MRPGLLFLICYHPPQSNSPGGPLRVLFLLLLLANVLFLAWTRWVVPVTPATIESPAPGGRELQPIRLRTESPNASAASRRRLVRSWPAGRFLRERRAVHRSSACGRGQRATRSGSGSRAASASRRTRCASATGCACRTWRRPRTPPTPWPPCRRPASATPTSWREGEPDNTVSVGVYADPRRAAEVAATVEKAGFTPEISDRLRTLEVLWLDIDRQANGSLPSLDVARCAPGGRPAATTCGLARPPARPAT